MEQYMDTYNDDFMRAFFKSHVDDLGVLLEKIPNMTLKSVQRSDKNIRDLLPEANRVFLVGFLI